MIVLNAGKGDSKYKICISDRVLPTNELNKFINKKAKVLIVTDSGVPKTHLKNLKQSIKSSSVYVLKINKGEKSKSFKNYQHILKKLIDLKFSRTDLIVAFGGGVVGDIAGFCAATFLRGIDYIQIPTTLLSQVDSSVGGKTAINVPQGKNLVGAFYNPKLVIILTTYLKTLSEKEYKSGLGEVLKYAFIDNQKLRHLIEKNSQKIINRDNKILKNIIEQSIRTKSKIVTKDEKESGIRAILNFGHTFGHAIEAHTGYKKLSHGAAITLGMIIASKISFFEGHIKDYQLKNIINLTNSIGLDTDHSSYKYSVLKKYIMNDKKVANGKLNLVMIDKNYKAFKTDKFRINNIKKAFSL